MKDTIKVVCLGDSITEGYGISQDPSAPYPAQLQTMLGNAYQVYNQGVSCTCTINRVLKGRTVGYPYMLEGKYQEALAVIGDIYVIMLGTNDAQDGFNDENGLPDEYNDVFANRDYFKEDYLKIIHDIKNINQDAAILMVRPVPVMECIWRKHQQSYLEKILPEYDEIKAKIPSLILVDLQKRFMEYSYEDREKLYQADGLHPSADGAKVIAENISRAIRNINL